MMPYKPFGGFDPSLAFQSIFKTKVSELKVYRGWSSERASGAGPGFSERIYGKAVVIHNDVCVVGTERRTNVLNLTLSSDQNAKEEWESIKGIGNVVIGKDAINKIRNTPEFQIRELALQSFDKSPPTAALLEDWSFECKIPANVLSKLAEDFANNLVEAVNIDVRWQNGVIKFDSNPSLELPGNLCTWGLYTIPGRDSPETLKGYVTHISWQLITE